MPGKNLKPIMIVTIETVTEDQRLDPKRIPKLLKMAAIIPLTLSIEI